jgi:hypothetical protein
MDEHLNDSDKVIFEESKWQRRQYEPTKKVSPIIEWVINHSGGRITEPSQANQLLIGFIILAIIASFILFNVGDSGVEPPREALKNPQYGLPQPD